MATRDDRKRCGAHSRRTGKPCKTAPVTGGTRCRMHGGTRQRAAPGSAVRGGRPVSTRLYSRHLRDDTLEAFELAKPGQLDDEIRLAKAQLDYCVKKLSEDPDGGVPVSVVVTGDDGEKRTVRRLRLWLDIVSEHNDKIRRLETARSLILQHGPPTGATLKPHEEWLKLRRSKEKKKPSRRRRKRRSTP